MAGVSFICTYLKISGLGPGIMGLNCSALTSAFSLQWHATTGFDSMSKLDVAVLHLPAGI